MAKFFGKIGYITTVEDLESPGVWVEKSIERDYYGNVERNIPGWQQKDQINDDLTLNNILSIVADSFACENLGSIKWVEWMGSRWAITKAEVKWPRIILTLGGVYNGEVRQSETP